MLELKIPPPLVLLLIGGIMGGFAPGPIHWSGLPLFLAGVCAVLALGIGLAALLAFRRHRTTVDPLHPEAAAALVTDGIFRHSRNPMYLGLVLLLTGWAILLGSLWSLAGIVAFVLYLNRFQIGPEERILRERFGTPYADYCRQVRRWL